jgi:small conductance mechanosensitive channel
VSVAAVAAVPDVLAGPPPTAFFQQLGESTVDLTVAGWLDQRSHDFFRTRSEAIRLVLTRVREAGIDLPEPTLRLRRAEPVRPPPSRHGPRPAVAAVPAAMTTTRDRSFDGVLDRERDRAGDLLEAAAARE